MVRLAELEYIAREVGKAVGETLESISDRIGTRIGFTLLIFDYTDDSEDKGWMTYISSARRDTMLEAMREFIAKHEENEA